MRQGRSQQFHLRWALIFPPFDISIGVLQENFRTIFEYFSSAPSVMKLLDKCAGKRVI
jgi:hypothetical protein